MLAIINETNEQTNKIHVEFQSEWNLPAKVEISLEQVDKTHYVLFNNLMYANKIEIDFFL